MATVSYTHLQFVLSLCLAILLEKDNSRRGVMLQGMFRSNFVLFGIPISTALFGDTAAGLASILIAVIIPISVSYTHLCVRHPLTEIF